MTTKHQPATPMPKKFARTLTCGHKVLVIFKKRAHYCESCHTRRCPVVGMDEE